MTRIALRVLLGTTLIAHGLANAVFPLRGIDAVAPGVWSFWLTGIYTLAILGLLMAGVGVLGVRPFDRVIIPATVTGSAASILAWVTLGNKDLWSGLVLDLTLAAVVVFWPVRPALTPAGSRHRFLTVVRDVTGIAFLCWTAASTLAWPWTRSWGTTPAEWRATLPGDREPRTPALELLHGVTIAAPPETVWRWLIELGQDRAGFYSYDRLERLFGTGIHNRFEIRPEWQTRAVGEQLPATHADYLGGVFGDQPGWIVERADADRALVLRNWGAFVLQPTGDGGTRFLIRSTISNSRIPAWLAGVNFWLFELPHFIMQRHMMLTIKRLSEYDQSTRTSEVRRFDGAGSRCEVRVQRLIAPSDLSNPEPSNPHRRTVEPSNLERCLLFRRR